MTNMNVDTNDNKKIWTDLEEYVMNSAETEFPLILSSEKTNTKPYPKRYVDFKINLGKEHDKVDYESTLSSFQKELDKLFTGEPNNDNLNARKDIYDNILVLTRHGKGHVESVIKHASNIIKFIENSDDKWQIKPFEAFILLCAIQIHDLGNKYGREKHTTSFYNDFNENARKSFITSNALKDCIYKIARVHGGKIEGDKDTIEKVQLQREKTIDNMDVKQQLLAAVLRFSDELADDQTRAKEITDMPEFSKIYHSYSMAIHTARVVKNKMNNTYFVEICFFLNNDEAIKKYKKIDEDGNIEEVTLIDEIFNRTIKMERERRYCSRYLSPYIQINEIKVEIDISSSTFDTYPIRYTLPAKGYPIEDICIPDRDKYINQIIKNTSQGGLNIYGQ